MMRRPARVVIVHGVVMAMLVAGVSAAVPAATPAAAAPAAKTAPVTAAASTSDALSAELKARATKTPVVIGSQTTPTSTTSANPDGSRTMAVSALPVRWRDGQGSWQPYDLTLADADATTLKATSSPSAVRLGRTADAGIVLPTEAGAIHAVPVGALGRTGTRSGGVAGYAGALAGGRDVTEQLLVDGVEETVTLPSASASPSYRVLLTLPAGMSARQSGPGIEFVDAAGKVVASYGGGVATDASGGLGAQTDVRTTLVSLTGSRALANVGIDPAWLADAKRVFPVQIDPTYYANTSSANNSDTWVESDSSSSFWTSTELRVGYGFGGSGTAVARSLIKFFLGTAPGSNDYVTEAHLRINNKSSSSCTPAGVYVTGLNGAFNSSTVWSNQPSPDSSGQVSGTSFAKGASGCPADWQNLDVTSLAKRWFESGAANYGFRLQSNELSNGGWKKFYSGETGGAAAPALYVTYDHKPNLPTGVIPSAQGYLIDPNGQLTAVVSDPDGGTVQSSWTVTDTTTSTVIINNGLSAMVPSGSTTSYSLAGRLTDGHHYTVSTRTCDGTACSAATTPAASTADFTAPSTPTVASSTYPANAWHAAGGSGAFTLSDASTDVDHYLYGINEATPTTSTPASLTVNPMPDGWHTLSVRAVDHAGLLSPIPSYSFGATPAFTAVSDGGTTAGLVSLAAITGSGSGVTVNYRRSDTDSWIALPAADVTQGGTAISGWPIAAVTGSVPGTSPAVTASLTPANLVWNAASTLAGQDGPLQLQVCFAAACSTTALHMTLDQRELGGGYATSTVGPGTVSLLTGNLSVGAGDVSVSTPNADLSVFRTFNSRYSTTPVNGRLGAGWGLSLPVNAAASDWTALTDTGSAVTLTAADGSTTSFAKTAGGYTPTGDDTGTGISLAAGGAGTGGPTSFTLTDLDGNKVTFKPTVALTGTASSTNAHTYQVSLVSQPGAGQTTYTYNGVGVGLPTRVLAAIPAGATCTDPASASTWSAGCQALNLSYDGNNHLTAVTLVSNSGSSVLSVDMACYSYNASGQLAQEWDPRNGTAGAGSHPVACGNPILATGYTYNTAGRIATITPPGLAAWQLNYDAAGRLTTAGRTHNATFGSGTETSTVVYGVPLTADPSHPEYRPDLSAATAGSWAQTDTPATATVIYPPGANVSSTDLRDGQLHYLDVNRQTVNTGDYAGSGSAGWHITTIEYDDNGNTVRGLSAANREEALSPTTGAGSSLGLPSDTAAAALALSDQSVYNTASDGVDDLTDTFGPYHQVTLADGTAIAARQQTHYSYDTGSETGHPSGGSLHLVTSETTGASESISPLSSNEQDLRRTDTAYALSGTDATGWAFSSPMKVTEDPAGLARTTITRYDPTTGNVIESRMPSNTAGGGAGTTLTVDYTAGVNSQDSACGNKPAWVGLVCETTPAAQPGVSGLPGLITKRTLSYDYLDRPTSQADIVTDAGGTNQTRTTATTYLNSGFGAAVAQVGMTGGLGAAVATKTIAYDLASGSPTVVSATATAQNPATSATTGRDDFGRTISYVDADESSGNSRNSVITDYDLNGRMQSVTDAHGARTWSYNDGNEHRGLATGLTVTVAASSPFTGHYSVFYNADGTATYQTDPNGISTAVKMDEAGKETSLATSVISTGAPWLVDTIGPPDVHGDTTTDAGPTGTHSSVYDALGRLAAAAETPTSGVCSTVGYALDIDSNRESSTAYPAAPDGSCQSSVSGVTTLHTYDNADRTQTSGADVGTAYDAFGRITTSPSPGGNVTLDYYAGDIVRSESANGLIRTWGLDASDRLKTWTDSGTGSGTKTNHYDDPASDNPSWIAENSNQTAWTVNVTDILGGLSATVDESGTATMHYADLHGDIVAMADASMSAPALRGDLDSYGGPVTGTASRYGWLGSVQRSGDGLGGFILMGLRLYSPTSGRFLSVDSEAGGSANSYDYAGQNPVDNYDLAGTCGLFGNPFHNVGIP